MFIIIFAFIKSHVEFLYSKVKTLNTIFFINYFEHETDFTFIAIFSDLTTFFENNLRD